MIIGIDTTNIRSNGGLTYLKEFVNNLDSSIIGNGKVIIWLTKSMSNQIKDRDYIVKIICKELDGSLFKRFFWQIVKLKKEVEKEKCDIIFVMGGVLLRSEGKRFVTINQNLLPFEFKELLRYGFSKKTIKLLLLRWLNIYTFKRSNGVIFLSEYAKNCVNKIVDKNKTRGIKKSIVIPHSGNYYHLSDRKQLNIRDLSFSNPYNITYISSIEPYKHHIRVIEAISILREKGLPVEINIVGGGCNKRSLDLLKDTIKVLDPMKKWINLYNEVDYNEIGAIYNKIDLMIHASTCETFGIPIMEALRSGIPVVCSNRSSMNSIFGDKVFYFDPLSRSSIVDVLMSVIKSPNLRQVQSERAFNYMEECTWRSVSVDTYNFITSCVEVDAYE
jgi:glycosyltransferase involved in cell wall biosynthesis